MNEPGIQSSLHAASGSGAALIQELGLVLYVGSAILFVLVISLLLRAVFSGARRVHARRWILGGGVVLPISVLSCLLIYSLAVGGALSDMSTRGILRLALDCISTGARALGIAAPAESSIRVEVIARQWWWEVRYLTPRTGIEGVVLANELHLPAGRPIELRLRSEDVIHSFWAPSLAGKVDMIPGRTNRLLLKADDTGVFRGQCAEYCGGQHALMAFYVIVEPEPEFQKWLEAQAIPAAVPDDPFLKAGHDAFLSGGCGACHTVRGTTANGRQGPDLTHVGGRHSLAAGILDNHIGTLAGWTAGSQDLKPGNRMPSLNIFTGRELRALAAWMESLK